MKMSLLEDLPTDILDRICSLLAPFDDTRRWLHTFSLTSTRCAAIALRYRLERINFRFEDEQQLCQKLGEVQSIFKGDAPRFLRQLKLSGPVNEVCAGWPNPEQTHVPLEESCMNWVDENLYDFCSSPHTLNDRHKCNKPTSTNEGQAISEDTWLTLAAFIRSLRSLTDFIHAGTDLLATSILAALHEDCPKARLHIHFFHLPSLPKDEACGWSSHEDMLVKSPSLHSICLYSSNLKMAGRPTNTHEYFLRLTNGPAPRLSKVTMVQSDLFSMIQRFSGGQLADGEGSSIVKGSVKTLNLDVEDLQVWGRYTRTDRIQSIYLFNNLDSHVQREKLLSFVRSSDLSSLRALRLVVGSETCSRLRVVEPHDARNGAILYIQELLTLLPSLEKLDLNGPILDEVVESILDSCGSTLKDLRLAQHPSFWEDKDTSFFDISLDSVKNLTKRCTQLGSLRLPVSRSGKQDEKEMYRTLGQLPCLKRVTLEFICPDTNIRDRLKLFAMDANLALKIFRTILGNKSKLMELRVLPHRAYLKSSLGQLVLTWLGRPWLCKISNGRAIATELSKFSEIRLRGTPYEPPDFDRQDFFYRTWGVELRTVWDDLWPGNPDGRAERWRSSPLEGV